VAWVKIDDQLYTHENRWEIGLDGIGLFVVMLCYCNHKLTDGLVPRAFVQSQVSRPDRRGALKSLLKVGMVAEVEDGYEVVGYLRFQPSKEDVLKRRADRSAAGRKGGEKKAQNRLAVAKQGAKHAA
jgi:hypothetical protein